MAQVILEDYHHFLGRHWETGSVCNYYAYQGVKAPHTGLPYSEALLLGISGGIVMGYFSFAYQGYDPHVALLTRNTFDPLQTLLERLGVAQEIRQTSNPATGLKNLVDTLEGGRPAITWVDIFSLPYFELPNDDDMWVMYPVLVFGYDEHGERVWIADRARAPLAVTPGQLAAARARVKQDKFRVMTLSSPDETRLPAAVSNGIWDTIKLFTEAPPRGSPHNFGFAAYRRWCSLLEKPKEKSSWAKVFPPGRPMVAGLVSAYSATLTNGETDDAERGAYAAFLEEAARILGRPALGEAAGGFRESAAAWQRLGQALLPEEVEPFGRLRRLLLQRKELFLDQDSGAAQAIAGVNAQIRALKEEAAAHFPLGEAELPAFFEHLQSRIMQVHDTEMTAIQALQEAMR